MNETYIDLEEVAKKLDINKATLLRAINDGELTAVTGVWRGHKTTQTWVQQWLDSKTVNAGQDKAGGAA